MQTSPATDHRLELRNNIFVMAALYADGGTTPVRVRNMSRNGALIEGASLPHAGTSIRLGRGDLSVSGHVMWVSERKAGLQFAAPVAVADWLPSGKRSSGQQLIDEVVHLTRLGGVTKSAAAHPSPDNSVALADELERLARLLKCAGEELALDSAVTLRHLVVLQIIDGAAQTLAKLASASADDQVPAPASASA